MLSRLMFRSTAIALVLRRKIGGAAVAGAVTALCFASATTEVRAEETFRSTADLVAAVMPSVVMIQNRGLTEDAVPKVVDDLGSGFIVDPSGIIVTNKHVIEGAYALSVDLSDGTHLSAKLIGKSTMFDIAVLKVEAGRPLQAVKVGDSDKLRVGDPVIAIGNPLGFARTVTAGVVSGFHRDIGTSAYDDLIQTDASVNRGNSGGPLFNMSGEVVGINQAISTQNQGGSIGISFSIPSNEARSILANVKEFGTPRIGWLGISGTAVSAAMANAIGLDGPGGVIIAAVSANSPASKAGLRVGDVILVVGDKRIDNKSILNRSIAAAAERSVPMQIFRDGKMTTVPVKIDTLAGDLWITKLADPRVMKSVADLGLRLGESVDRIGVSVDNVADKSVAWAAGIRPGDKIRKVQFGDVSTVDEFTEKLIDLQVKSATNAILLVTGGAGTRWVNLSVKEW